MTKSDDQRIDLTRHLRRFAAGDKSALDDVFAALDPELRQRAAEYMQRERRDHTLQPTALVNEVYIRLNQQKTVRAHDRSHFLAIATKKMREILLNHARPSRKRQPRSLVRVPLDGLPDGETHIDILELEKVLDCLAKQDERIIDLLHYRIFGGMTVKEIGEVMGIHVRTAQRLLRTAYMFLLTELRAS